MSYSNSTVAHAWAHNLDKCHSGSSTYQDNGVMKSYNTCIAQRIELNGKATYILNHHFFSSSTCKHQRDAYRAVPEGALTFSIDLENWGASEIIYQNRWSDDPEGDRMQRIRFGIRFIIAELYDCLNMKTSHKINSSFSRHGYDELLRWLEFTKDTTIAKLLRLPEAEFGNYIHNDDHYELRKEMKCNDATVTRTVRRFLRMLHTEKDTEEICDAINGEGTYAEWNKYQQRIIKANETRQKNEAVREIKWREARTYVEKVIQERGDAGRRDLWHEGYNVSVYNMPASFFYGGNVLLRKCGKGILTSKGIRVTVEECHRLWTIISRWHSTGAVFENGDVRVHATLSNFTIRRFQNDILIAGCHAIAYKEVENAAHQLGFI